MIDNVKSLNESKLSRLWHHVQNRTPKNNKGDWWIILVFIFKKNSVII
jgi:hypothetical protein